jgi:hypothetical protein
MCVTVWLFALQILSLVAFLRPWTEVGGTIVQIPNSKLGRIDVGHLRDQLGK